MPEAGGKTLSPEELTDIVRSYFPNLDSDDFSSVVEPLKKISVQDLRFILNCGKFTFVKGRRVIRSYLKAAPQVYRLLPQDGFRNWILLAQKASFLSISLRVAARCSSITSRVMTLTECGVSSSD